MHNRLSVWVEQEISWSWERVTKDRFLRITRYLSANGPKKSGLKGPPSQPHHMGGPHFLKLFQECRFAPGWAKMVINPFQLWLTHQSTWISKRLPALTFNLPLPSESVYALHLLVALLCFRMLTLDLAPASLDFPFWRDVHERVYVFFYLLSI